MNPSAELQEYLKSTREKRKSLINIANEYLKEIIIEEKETNRGPTSAPKTIDKENESKLPALKLSVIYEKRSSSSLRNRISNNSRIKSEKHIRLQVSSAPKSGMGVLRKRNL